MGLPDQKIKHFKIVDHKSAGKCADLPSNITHRIPSIYKRPQLYRKNTTHNTKSISLVLRVHFKERYKKSLSATRHRTGH